MYNVQELATAALHGIDVVAIVFADGAYGNVRRMQKNDYGNKLIAVDLLNPSFPKMADSYGIAGVRATSPDELRRELAAAFKRRGPSLIEVPVGEMPDPWPTPVMPRVRGRRARLLAFRANVEMHDRLDHLGALAIAPLFAVAA